MCLWTHVGQRKQFDCNLRKNVGRFRFGCSVHLSYRESSSSPRIRRKSFPKQSQSSHLNSNGYCNGLRNLPSLDHSKLSSSLSSLRHLTDLSSNAGENRDQRKYFKINLVCQELICPPPRERDWRSHQIFSILSTRVNLLRVGYECCISCFNFSANYFM